MLLLIIKLCFKYQYNSSSISIKKQWKFVVISSLRRIYREKICHIIQIWIKIRSLSMELFRNALFVSLLFNPNFKKKDYNAIATNFYGKLLDPIFGLLFIRLPI